MTDVVEQNDQMTKKEEKKEAMEHMLAQEREEKLPEFPNNLE